MSKTIIVYGAQGVGKGEISKSLSRAGGHLLIDGWDGVSPLPDAPAGVVAVTNACPAWVLPGALYVHVERRPALADAA